MADINEGKLIEKLVVSVIIPVRNEEKFIKECIQSLLKQNYPKEKMEFIFVDGESEDKTIDYIQCYINQYPDLIKLEKNKKKTVPYAMNIGIKQARGKYIIRIDAHSEYAEDYIKQCINYLEKTGADNVGGPMIAKGKNPIQKVIAASYYSKFAMGGGKFHDENYEGYADTVYLGAYRRSSLLKIGGYDEALTRNQDDELNFRLTKNGGKVFITPKIKSIYFPRSSYKELFSQYYQYGYWKVAVIKKHGKIARITHLVPMIFVMFLLFGALGSAFSEVIFWLFSEILFIYLLINIYFSFSNKQAFDLFDKIQLIIIHSILHTSYGGGFLCGLLKSKYHRNI